MGEHFSLQMPSQDIDLESVIHHSRLQRKKALEEKMDNVIWKMNLIIVAVVCVVFGCLLRMYAAKK
jgi:hypothetical protein